MNRKFIFQYLLRIPLVIVADAVLLTIALVIDSVRINSLSEELRASAIPYFTLTIGSVMALITVLVIVYSLYKTIGILINPNSEIGRAIHPIVPISFTLILSVILVFTVTRGELNLIVANQSKPGTPMPVVSLFVAFAMLVINVIVAIRSIWVYRKKL